MKTTSGKQLSLLFPESGELPLRQTETDAPSATDEPRRERITFHLERALRFVEERFVSTHIFAPYVDFIVPILLETRRFWRRVTEAKPDGGVRVCYEPLGVLRTIQERILASQRLLLRQNVLWRRDRDFCFELTGSWHKKKIATAFDAGSSILRNAKRHIHNRSSLSFDLHDAYGQIKAKHVFALLKRQHNELTGSAISEAWLVSRLVTMHGRLVQGAVTSPFIFNAVMSRFDEELARRLGAPAEAAWILHSEEGRDYKPCCHDPSSGMILTRFVDDVCVSSPAEVFPEETKRRIFSFVESQGFRIVHRKTRQGRNGILVFPGVNIIQGRIEPNHKYLETLAHFREMPPEVKAGHLAYLRQYPKGTLRQLRQLPYLVGSGL